MPWVKILGTAISGAIGTERKALGSEHPRVWATALNDDTKSPKNPNIADAEE